MATDPTKDKTQQAIADAEAEAAAKKAARDAANAEETAALQALQAKELEGLQQHNAAQYSNLGQIVGDIQSKIDVAKAKDETAQKRENAYRYISGLGDTLSSLANLVGVANKASNQQQTYNSHAVVQKAEEARKARKIEMDDLSKRLDEMRARQREMKTAGSLAEAELKARQAKDLLNERIRLDSQAREDAWRDKQQAWREEEAARAQENADRAFAEGQRQFNATNTRLTEAAEAERASREELKKLEIASKAAKNAEDPKVQARVLHSNISGVRDELAKKMGYADYNEYLRYQNIEGWGTDIDGQRNRESRAIRQKRSSENPETEELLKLLQNPEDLTEEQIRMVAGTSSVFADAISSAGAEPETNPNNGKKKVW